jgi:hypothetical protein
MPFNPEMKKKYDKQRYAKQKEEYLKLNPYYIPVRTQQRLNREALLNQTNKPNTDKNDSEFIIDNMILKCDDTENNE